MKIMIGRTLQDYAVFLKIKSLPKYSITGQIAEVPDEYANILGLNPAGEAKQPYKPTTGLWDYQRDIAATAICKRKFAVFADCGLGKTLICAEFAKHAHSELPPQKKVLILSPLMVVDQTVAEIDKFYGGSLPVEHIRAGDVGRWLNSKIRSPIGITNYECLKGDFSGDSIGAIICDESSLFKDHYGTYGRKAIAISKDAVFKLSLTGTPAPNDRIEFANQAVFLDQFPNVNSFLAKYFVNRGQTNERWEIKPHAIESFYRQLSHWCIFLSNPATYGWRDNTSPLPPINVHIEDVDLTTEQSDAVQKSDGDLFHFRSGGIVSRQQMSRIAKGSFRGKAISTNKPSYIVSRVNEWIDSESTIVWCLYNDEQSALSKLMPRSASISGETPHEERMAIIRDFKQGKIRTLISKPKILGFGLNLQVCTRMVFSGLQDSYESYYQAVKRANRFGSTVPLNVHIPTTDIERPMIDSVIRKAGRVQLDAEEQQRLFTMCGVNYLKGNQ